MVNVTICPMCGSSHINEDHIQVGEVEYECMFCLDCCYVFRRYKESD